MDDPDITGLLHKELIFLKLPSFIANKHLYGSINSRGRDPPAKRHLILLVQYCHSIIKRHEIHISKLQNPKKLHLFKNGVYLMTMGSYAFSP